jgi:3-oxoacyl-[acyl-carrier protein] reductase
MQKTVFISGASRGIGAAIAHRFAKEGYALVINCSKSKSALFTLKETLEQTYHVPVFASIGNVGDYNYIANLFSQIKEHFGGIDILINNAGISHIGLLTDTTLEEWNNILNINLSSAFYTSKHAIPYMLSKQAGKIINISSVWGICGSSCEVHYSTAKAGLIGMTKALAKELGPSGIRVNAVAPGVINTDMNKKIGKEDIEVLKDETPLMRIGEPFEIARAVLFLSSDESSFITGDVINASGGFIV